MNPIEHQPFAVRFSKFHEHKENATRLLLMIREVAPKAK